MELVADGLHIVVIGKGIVSFIVAFRTVCVKNFIGNVADGGVNRFKRLIVFGIKIVATAFVYNVVISGNNLDCFVGKIMIAFLLKKVHDLNGRLVKTFVN